MNDFCENLNSLLVRAFRSVLKLEEKTLQQMHSHLTINEFHLLECVSETGEITIGELARRLSLTPPSVTVAVNKLEKKGLLKKTKGAEDGRTVLITLSEHGAKIDRVHQRFHESMVVEISEGMTGPEKEALLSGIQKLNQYFDKQLEEI